MTLEELTRKELNKAFLAKTSYDVDAGTKRIVKIATKHAREETRKSLERVLKSSATVPREKLAITLHDVLEKELDNLGDK